MVKKVLVSLGPLLADAQERGLVIRNAVREKSRARQQGKDRRQERRRKGKLKIGVAFRRARRSRQLSALWRAAGGRCC
jgi:integrase